MGVRILLHVGLGDLELCYVNLADFELAEILLCVYVLVWYIQKWLCECAGLCIHTEARTKC